MVVVPHRRLHFREAPITQPYQVVLLNFNGENGATVFTDDAGGRSCTTLIYSGW